MSAMNDLGSYQDHPPSLASDGFSEGAFLLDVNSKWQRTDSIPLSDRGFRYGMHLFESMAVIHGRPEFLEEHLRRLTQAASQSGYCPPAGWEDKLRSAFHLPASTKPLFARIHLTAGDGAPADPPALGRVIVSLEHRSRELPAFYNLHPLPCPAFGSDQPESGHLKSGHYALRCSALREAKANAADEALLVDASLGALSCAMANFFWKQNGRWFTPPIGKSVRNGVWREWWMHECEATENTLPLAHVDQIESAALTGSWIGVMPVRNIGQTTLPHLAPRIPTRPS